ncbi:MAG: tetratricopeptide repeat protein [Verrucomicrobiota bacterium]
MRPFLLFPAALLLACAPISSAQTLIFPAGSVELAEVTIVGTDVQRKTGGPKIPVSSIVRVEFPKPEELAAADDLLLKAKYEEAYAKAKITQDFHRPWKDKPGSWYAPASLLVAESLLRQNKYDDSARLMSELRNMTLPGQLQMRVTLLDAREQFQKGINQPALTKVNSLLKSVKDSDTAARLYLLLGDIQFKRESFEEALDAYLHVPVFYGAEAAFLPAADLGAARSLSRLGRFKDAIDSFARISERYLGTPEADAAQKEKADLSKLQGQ